MSQKRLFDTIQSLHAEMRDITLAARVKEEDYNDVLSLSGVEEQEDIHKIKDFLTHVRQNQYRAVLEIWNLLPPNIWSTYLAHGETTLREQRLLREARRNLKKVWVQFLKDRSYVKVKSESSAETVE